MVHVQSILRTAQLTHYSLSHVPIGSIMIILKIISSIVFHCFISSNFHSIISSVLVWNNDPTALTFVAYSSAENFQVLLPAGDLHLVVHIRDTADCVTVYNLSSIIVQSDSTAILNLMSNTLDSSANPLVQLLSSRNPDTVGQVISSISQQLNTMNNQAINQVISSRYGI